MEQDCTLLKICKGVNVSKGIAIGKVYIYKPFVPCILDTSLNKDEIPSEIAKFKKGQEELDKTINQTVTPTEQPTTENAPTINNTATTNDKTEN